MKNLTILISIFLLLFFVGEAQSQNKTQNSGIKKSKIDKPVTKQYLGFSPNGYCLASGGCDEYILQVQVGGINNTSTCDNYHDYTNISTNLPLNMSWQAWVTIENYYDADSCGIWVDWNRDEDFDDPGEAVVVSLNSPSLFTGLVTPPSWATTGDCVMRIRVTYGLTPTPCGDDTWGEVEDYTITLTPKVDNQWYGTISNSWNDDGNWSLGHTPTDDENVMILSLGNQPVQVPFSAECADLTIASGEVDITGGDLTVNGNISIAGKLSASVVNGTITCYGNVYWNNNSTAGFSAYTSFKVQGHWFFNTGANAQLANGKVEFFGNGESQFKCKSPTCSVYDLYLGKTAPGTVTVAADANFPFVINGSFYIMNGNTFTNSTDQDIICRGHFINDGDFDLTLNDNSSTFIFDGASQSIIPYNANGYFNNVKISPSVSVTMSGDVHIYGNLTIDQGMLDPQGHTITIDGNWTNQIGSAGFNEGTGTVVFYGAKNQDCYTETFNNLMLNKSSGDFQVLYNHAIICQSYRWLHGRIHVTNGTFTANDLYDDGIYGSYLLDDPWSTVNLHQDNAQYVDLNGSLEILDGEMNVYGGNGSSYWPWATDASITMSGGTLDFHDVGIWIYDTDVYSLTENITGGTIRTSGGFRGDRSDFTPWGGTFEFYGTSDYTLGQSNGCTLYNVIVDKSVKDSSSTNKGEPVVDSRSGKVLSDGGKSNTISLSSDYTITNDMHIQSGEMKLAGYSLNVMGNCFVEGTLTMDNNSDVLSVSESKNDGDGEFNISSSGIANFLKGTTYLYGCFKPNGIGITLNTTTDNTVVFIGNSAEGIVFLTDPAPSLSFGNIIINKNSYQTTDFFNVISTSTIAIPITVNGNFTISGNNNTLNLYAVDLNIKGTFTDNVTSKVYLYDILNKLEKNSTKKIISYTNTMVGGSKSAYSYIDINTDVTLNGLMDIANFCHLDLHQGFDIASTGILSIDGGTVTNDRPFSTTPNTITGTVNMSDGLFEVTNNGIVFGSSATTNITGGTLRCGGDFKTIAANGLFTPSGGTVELSMPSMGGSSTYSYLYMGNGSYFHNLLINHNGSALISTYKTDIRVNNNLAIQNGILECELGETHDLYVGGNWDDQVMPWGFNPNQNKVIFFGPNTSVIQNQQDFYDLVVDKSSSSAQVSLTHEMIIDNDLTINGGVLKSNSHQITIHGDWLNNVGPAAFGEDNGTVIIAGGPTECLSEDFYDLKISDYSTISLSNGQTVSCQELIFDNTNNIGTIDVSNGTFTAWDLFDDYAIHGNYYLSGNTSAINLHQDNQHEINFAANISIFDGEMNVYGGSSDSKWADYGSATLTMSGGTLNFADQGIWFIDQTSVTLTLNITGGTIKTGGSFHGNHGVFYSTGGTVEMTGELPGSYIELTPLSKFYNLTINSTSGYPIQYKSDIWVKNDLTILNGILECGDNPSSSYDLYIGGNWNDPPAGFFYNAGNVIFNGSGSSNLLTDEIFNNLTVDKTTTGTNGLEIPAGLDVNVLNDLNVNDGALVLQNSDLTIGNDLAIQNNAFLDVPDNTQAEINIGGNWTNLNTINSSTTGFWPGMSTVTFYGTGDQELHSNTSNGNYFYIFNIQNNPYTLTNYANLTCYGDFHVFNGGIVDNYGGTSDGHSFYGDFIIDENGSVDFSGHILGIIGNNNTLFSDMSSNNNNYGATIYINKDNPMDTVTLSGNNVSGLTVTSIFQISQGYVNALTSLNCDNIDIQGGTFNIGEGITLAMENNLTVGSGGTIEVLGSLSNPAIVTKQNGSVNGYGFNINSGGTISADNAVFEYMGTSFGINVGNGAIIDPVHCFNNCTFRNGIAQTSMSTYLTIDNTQTLTIHNASFPTAGLDYNVFKENTPGVISFVDYTGPFSGAAYEYDPYDLIDWAEQGYDLDLKVYLEGPFNGTDMDIDLLTNNYIPIVQPYDPALPYYDNSNPVWLYNGSEGVVHVPTNVVDWVIVQLRDADSPQNAGSSTIVDTQAAFLLNDGSVVELDGSSILSFSPSSSIVNNMYVVVFHRNHLGIISNYALTESGGVYTYDFTTGSDKVYGGVNGYKQLGTGKWGMVAGDGNGSGIVGNTDETSVWKIDLGTSGYSGADFDLNGYIQNTDETNYWKVNLNAGGQVPGKSSGKAYRSMVPE